MTQAPQKPGTAPRSDFIDILRGFALIGICVVNLPFLAAPIIDPRTTPPDGMDALVQALVSLLFEGKFFLIFSFLFGVGFSIHLARQTQGRATAATWGRRLVGLFLIGLIHAVLFFPGDILMGYAVLATILWSVRRWTGVRLFHLAGWLAVLAAMMLAFLGMVLSSDFGDVDGQRAAALVAYGQGGFGDALMFRLGELGLVIPFIIVFNWPLALAAFCLGLAAGRHGAIFDPERVWPMLKPWQGWLWVGAAIGNAGFAWVPWMEGPEALIGLASLALGGPCLATLYVAYLAALTRRAMGRRLLGGLIAPGRMSLTNYLAQSVLANLLFMGWGLGFYGHLDRAALLAVALATALVLSIISGLWLRRFHCGPDEWLLRSWAALRWQPFLRR